MFIHPCCTLVAVKHTEVVHWPHLAVRGVEVDTNVTRRHAMHCSDASTIPGAVAGPRFPALFISSAAPALSRYPLARLLTRSSALLCARLEDRVVFHDVANRPRPWRRARHQAPRLLQANPPLASAAAVPHEFHLHNELPVATNNDLTTHFVSFPTGAFTFFSLVSLLQGRPRRASTASAPGNAQWPPTMAEQRSYMLFPSIIKWWWGAVARAVASLHVSNR